MSAKGGLMGTKKVGALSSRRKRAKFIIPQFTRLPIARMGVLLYKKVGESKRHKKGKIAKRKDLTLIEKIALKGS
jgi:hypothetical protein